MLSRRRSFDAAVFFSISDSNIYHFCGMSAGANIGRRRAAATRAGDQRRARLGDGYTAHRLLAGSSAPAPRPAPPNSTVRPSDRPTRKYQNYKCDADRPAQNKTNRRNLRRRELV